MAGGGSSEMKALAARVGRLEMEAGALSVDLEATRTAVRALEERIGELVTAQADLMRQTIGLQSALRGGDVPPAISPPQRGKGVGIPPAPLDKGGESPTAPLGKGGESPTAPSDKGGKAGKKGGK